MGRLVILLAMFLASCVDMSESSQCEYDRDVLQSLDDCLAHPQCKLNGDEFHIAKQLRRKIARRCSSGQ